MFLIQNYLFYSTQHEKDKFIEEVSELRDKMKHMVQDASNKENLLAQLKHQQEYMKKDINRQVILLLFYELEVSESK